MLSRKQCLVTILFTNVHIYQYNLKTPQTDSGGFKTLRNTYIYSYIQIYIWKTYSENLQINTNTSKIEFLFLLIFFSYTICVVRKILFHHQWSPLPLLKLTFINNKIKTLSSSRTKYSLTKYYGIWLYFLPFYPVQSGKSYRFQLYVPINTYILIYKAWEFCYDFEKLS